MKIGKIDDFGGPAHLAWTPPKIEKLTKPAKTIEISCPITKTVKTAVNMAFQVDLPILGLKMR